ncbi:hypothetical protein PB01_03885 [Psychrobacillus glaciei]|uniref:O-antigen ligase domain-containing protein n=1 Tax=Psychrobacillus glaciei TaxID=2283160 RepID=A0A5J6SJF4_9BACI|nr:hypothetical protein [Psychrobacillus glaciei]QFF98025.1 hypothetical protein PB01_03885 [Psychrobacillus glaciei]
MKNNKLIFSIDRLIILLLSMYIVISVLGTYGIIIFDYYLKLLILFCLLTYVMLSIYFKILNKSKFKVIDIFSIFYILYYLIYLLINNSLNLGYVLIIFYFPLITLAASFSIKKSNLQFVLNLFLILSFFLMLTFSYETIILGEVNGIYINTIYYSILSILFVLINKNVFVKYLGIFYILILSAYSSKRTALIIALIIISLEILRNISKNNSYYQVFLKYLKISLSIFLVIFSFYATVEIFNSKIDEKILNIFNDGGSGRTDIIYILFNELKISNIFEILWGHGVNSTSIYTGGLSAHNDFLEVFFNYGLFGLMLYIVFWVILLYRLLIMRKAKSDDTFVYMISIIVFLFVSLFSHLIYIPTYILLLIVFWNMVWQRQIK